MGSIVKAFLALLVFLAVYVFSFWVVFAQFVPANLFWLASLGSFLSAAAAAVWVWRATGGAKHGIFATALRWAAIAGGIGFCGGFFGPLIFTPSANQGPMLGLFITGPLGFVAGGIAGLIYGIWQNRSPAR